MLIVARCVQAECQAEADKDRARYREELQAWRAAHPAAATARPRSTGVKKAPSAYILYLKDFRCALCSDAM